MKSSTSLTQLLLSILITSAAASIFGGTQNVLDSKTEVPGDNPMVFCQDTSDYILTIDYVDLSPNPPIA